MLADACLGPCHGLLRPCTAVDAHNGGNKGQRRQCGRQFPAQLLQHSATLDEQRDQAEEHRGEHHPHCGEVGVEPGSEIPARKRREKADEGMERHSAFAEENVLAQVYDGYDGRDDKRSGNGDVVELDKERAHQLREGMGPAEDIAQPVRREEEKAVVCEPGEPVRLKELAHAEYGCEQQQGYDGVLFHFANSLEISFWRTGDSERMKSGTL